MRRSVRSTVSAATTATGAAQRAVRVVLLDRTEMTVYVEGKARVTDVFHHVCEHLNLRETEYFSLAQLVDGEYQFLDENLKLHKIASKGWKNKSADVERPVLILYLRVQYYVEHISLLKERSTRQQYYLQLRDNLLHHSQLVSEEKCFLLAAYALQADHGDYNQTKHATNYFDPREYFPAWVVDQRHENYIQQHLPAMHNEFSGMTKLEAIRNFIKEVSQSPTAHNLHFYKLKRKKTDPLGSIWLAICPKGIEICEEANGFKSPLSSYTWSEISKLHSDKKKFEIRIVGGSERKFVYYTSGEEWGRNLIAFCRKSHNFQISLQPKLAEIRHLDAHDKRYRETYIYSENTELSWEQNSSCRSTKSLGSTGRSSVGMVTPGVSVAVGGTSSLPTTSSAPGVPSAFESSQRVSIVSSTSSNTTSGIVSDKMHVSLDESEDDRSHEIIIDCPPVPVAANSFPSLWASTPQSIQGLSPIASNTSLHRHAPVSRTSSSQSQGSSQVVLPPPPSSSPPSAPPPSLSPPTTGPVPAKAHIQRTTFAPTMTVTSNPVKQMNAPPITCAPSVEMPGPAVFSTPVSKFHAPIQQRQLHEAAEAGLQYSYERIPPPSDVAMDYGIGKESYEIVDQQHDSEVVSAMEIMAQLYPSPASHPQPQSYPTRLQQRDLMLQQQQQQLQQSQLQQHHQNQIMQRQQNQFMQHHNQQLQQQSQLQPQSQLQHQQQSHLQQQQQSQLQQQSQQLQQQSQQLQQKKLQLQQQEKQLNSRQDLVLQALLMQRQDLQHQLQVQQQLEAAQSLQTGVPLPSMLQASYAPPAQTQSPMMLSQPARGQQFNLQQQQQQPQQLLTNTPDYSQLANSQHLLQSHPGLSSHPPPPPYSTSSSLNSMMHYPTHQPLYQAPNLLEYSQNIAQSNESLSLQQPPIHGHNGHVHVSSTSSSNSGLGTAPPMRCKPVHIYENLPAVQNAVNASMGHKPLTAQNSGPGRPQTLPLSQDHVPQPVPAKASPISVGVPMQSPLTAQQLARQAHMVDRRQRSATVALVTPVNEYLPQQHEVKVTRAKSAATALPSYRKSVTQGAELNNNMVKQPDQAQLEPSASSTPNRYSGGDLVRAASEDTLDTKRRSHQQTTTCPVHSMRSVVDKIRGLSSSNNVSLPMLTGLCNDQSLMLNNICTCSELSVKETVSKRFSLTSPPIVPNHINEPGTAVRPVSWHSELFEQHLRDLSGGDDRSNGCNSSGSLLSLPAVPLSKSTTYSNPAPVSNSRKAQSLMHVNGSLGLVPTKLSTGGHSPNNSDTVIPQKPGVGMA